ncbi:hypothetical protein [Actinomycetospora flava]|uniref:Uncharacterized protein n=1 Tax=Actinomycetospora flava TaxID=3129232 RepID=A0ABU8LXW1_9PSEU
MSSPIGARAGVAAVVVAVVAVLALVITLIVVLSRSEIGARPRCTITAPPDSPGLPATWTLSPEQADSAATIAGVGRRLGVPDRAVTIALATAIQESTLANLRGGDRDSLGLFQQRPSQGWGSEEEILDPVYSSTAFYEALLQVPNWATMDITVAAQTVQRSGFPEAYADHEPEARLMAVSLLGQAPGSWTCVDLPATPAADPGSGAVAELAASELGTRRLSGAQEPEAGWAIATWLVAHAERLALESVTFDGRTWSVGSGAWEQTGPADGRLALRRLGQP